MQEPFGSRWSLRVSILHRMLSIHSKRLINGDFVSIDFNGFSRSAGRREQTSRLDRRVHPGLFSKECASCWKQER